MDSNTSATHYMYLLQFCRFYEENLLENGITHSKLPQTARLEVAQSLPLLCIFRSHPALCYTLLRYAGFLLFYNILLCYYDTQIMGFKFIKYFQNLCGLAHLCILKLITFQFMIQICTQSSPQSLILNMTLFLFMHVKLLYQF